jgi:hypothetical protein
MLGEKLLIKMWETLTEKGIGSLLEPWHKSRISKVELEAKRNEIIILADAERKAEDIRKGIVKLDNPNELTLSNIDEINTHIESTKKIENIKKEINISKAILYAEEELKDDMQEPPQEEIDEDWLYKWKNCASEVSKEELQQIWGKLLAGELKSPGKYSLRTIDFLKNISQNDALLIEKVAQFNISECISKDEDEKNIMIQNGVSFKNLLYLQELGLLYGVDSLGLAITYNSDIQGSFQKVLISNKKALILTHKDDSKKITLKMHGISTLGSEVLSLGSFNSNEEYLISIGKRFAKEGFEVSLADCKKINEEEVYVENAIKIEV